MSSRCEEAGGAAERGKDNPERLRAAATSEWITAVVVAIRAAAVVRAYLSPTRRRVRVVRL